MIEMPMAQAVRPERIESSPRLGPTVRSSMIFTGAGSAPARRTMARLRASSERKFPSTIPAPPGMRPLIRGAE